MIHSREGRWHHSDLQSQEVTQQFLAMGRKDRLWMKLNTPERKRLVTESHNLSFSRLSRDLQTFWKSFTPYQETVITGRLEGIGKTGEKILPVMQDW